MSLNETPNIITTEHKLLENIQNLLIEQNKMLKVLTEKQEEKPVVDTVEKEIKQENILVNKKFRNTGA